MTYEEKAQIILESLDNRINVNWNLEEFYIKSIIEGLVKIEKEDIKK